ncbi:PQQ-dependent sugar dehydrogenase [Chitinophaga caseinilytica]|uniref:PQQ-dependent sugar dehydrogenase n=1 Tax=Chitinophaga caseinilytica TaxID=2267521 RepID=A0ABZ2Z3U5_9BACT
MKKLWMFGCMLALAACSRKSPGNKVLLLPSAGSTETMIAAVKASAEANGWELVEGNKSYLHPDSLQHFRTIVSNWSYPDSLDHRQINALQRYLEAGGTWAVMKDSSFKMKGWPWLDALADNDQVFMGAPEEAERILTKAGDEASGLDYAACSTPAIPENNRYTYTMLAQGLDEPLQLAVLPGNDVMFAERKGAVRLYRAREKDVITLAQFNVYSGLEDGLLGVALDPEFDKNHWVYFYYAVGGDAPVSRLTRMEMRDQRLLHETEKTLLEIPTQRKHCCHSAGYIEFGPDKLLYLSTGDNTNAEETEGYTPVDERPGRELADDQATSASSADLRGKILRIRPKADGTYEIPDGNLFPKDGSKGRPEIYVMGCRNPFRFTVDRKNQYVYWGDVGPDTKVPGSEGTISYDEVNQARKPGFFGWPYFLGENEALPKWDFATKTEGPKLDPAKPINSSPNNKGVKELPPAQGAMIWFGDGPSTKFPLVGKGGQSVMAGPVYYADQFKNAEYKLSDYYDGKLLIYDWVRRWIMAVTFDENHNYLRMEPFLDHLAPAAPIDLRFADDGAIYMIEYGTNWFSRNMDARLVRITYAAGNRRPVAGISADHLTGPAPMTVKLSADGSSDPDRQDQLHYSWNVDGKDYSDSAVAHTFAKPGVYKVLLTVTDDHKAFDTASIYIKAGNTPPDVQITTTANSSFYWDNMQFPYKVTVTDPEDGTIAAEKVAVGFNYIPYGRDMAGALTQGGAMPTPKGKELFYSLDCKACHTENTVSVGPSLMDVAAKYERNEKNTALLADKVIRGGSGVWGNRPMSAHPGMAVEEAKVIVDYILSLRSSGASLPAEGAIALKEHIGKSASGVYLLTARYTDKGANGIEALTGQQFIMLRHPKLEAEERDTDQQIRFVNWISQLLSYGVANDGSSFVFKNIDLGGISRARFRVQLQGAGGTLELRMGAKDGPVAATLKVPAGDKGEWVELTAPVKANPGRQDLWFVFSNPGQGTLFNIDWTLFENGK